jgi:Common central domain of tyrosinase
MRKFLILPALVALLGALRAEAAQVQIQLRGTDDPNNDYIAWSPVPATIRVSDPAGLTGDLRIVLSNGIGSGQSCDGVGHGAVAFAASVGSGETASADELSLTLPRDGKPVPFVVAGKFKCPSIGEKDAPIHVRSTDGMDLTTHSIMVRVRKDVENLSKEERDIYLKALRAIKLRNSDDAYSFEGFVRAHRLSSLNNKLTPTDPLAYPDQAHRGPAFLAWHRAYLLEFERELQKIDPRVALPYWRIWQPSKTMPKLFNSAFLGSNGIAASEQKELTVFDLANPLYGWEMPYDDAGMPSEKPQQLYRYQVDWKEPQEIKRAGKIVGPNAIEGFLTKPSYRDFTDKIEESPHNQGHVATGPWMENCKISPSDPVFWLFHTEHDRLWAEWQYRNNRFDNKGVDRDAYYVIPKQKDPNDPNYGRFDPKPVDKDPKACEKKGGWSCPAFGHNLRDTMWPWDGITGGVNKVYAERRPEKAELSPFPRSAVPGLWPAADAKPRPADVIDYAGVIDRSMDLGYGYDDVPFGVKPPSVAVAAVVPPADTPVPSDELARIAVRKDAVPADRLKALQTLGDREDVALLATSRRIIGQHDAARPELAREVIAEFSLMMMTHGDLMTAHHHDIMSIAEAALTYPDAATRSAAAELLIDMDDPIVADVLKSALAKPSAARFSRVEAILLLGGFGEQHHADLLRPYLRSSDQAVQLVTLQELAGDKASEAARTALMKDSMRALELREAALDSLVPNNPALPDAAGAIAADKAEAPALRQRALADLGAYVMANHTMLGKADLAVLKEKVTALDAADLPKPVADNVKATIDAALANK